MGRRRTMTLDWLEKRDLLSITPLINSPGWVQALTSGTGGGGGGTGTGGQGSNGGTSGSSPLTNDPLTGLTSNNGLGGSGITSETAPARPNEAARRVFTAKFTGRVQEEPPRLVTQTRQYYILAPGTSSAFLHGTAQLRYYTPNMKMITYTDPTTGQVVTDNPIATTGTISMADRSTQSGTVILANLIGSPTDEDALGRPTRFNLTLNGGGGSGGTYASSTGSGTLNIAYHGNKATITVHASIFLSGVGNPYDIYQGITL